MAVRLYASTVILHNHRDSTVATPRRPCIHFGISWAPNNISSADPVALESSAAQKAQQCGCYHPACPCLGQLQMTLPVQSPGRGAHKPTRHRAFPPGPFEAKSVLELPSRGAQWSLGWPQWNEARFAFYVDLHTKLLASAWKQRLRSLQLKE